MADKYNAEQLRELAARAQTFDGGDSYPIADAEDLDNAVQAVGRGDASHDATRRYVIARAQALHLTERIPADWNGDGSLADAARSDTLTDPEVTVLGPGGYCERSYLLDDISIRADGTGRTVVAYAAVFNKPSEVRDQDGHYLETIDPSTFNKSISERSSQVQCFYNHGMTLYGTPSERFSMPLGVPQEIRADTKGLLTVTRYNKTPLADEVLEAVRNGDIRAQSFSGRFIQSRRTRARTYGDLDTIHRSECALREYGPTPIPTYADAAIVGVRNGAFRPDQFTETALQLSDEQLAETIGALPDELRARWIQLLGTSRSETPPPAADAASSTAAATPTPVIHAGPTQDQRLRRLRVLALTAPKGHINP